MTSLKKYEHATVSQWGEEGVIDEIFNRIGVKYEMCVDVGAWDGKLYSNTYLLSAMGWHRIMFEKNEKKADLELLPNDVFIAKEVKDLDAELKPLNVPTDFDFLNIDIDGDDYWLWHDMLKYRPKVICIEYNQTVAPGISVVQERGGSFGASSKALLDLAELKGYVFVHATVTNMFFVLKEYERFFPMVSGIPTEWVVYGGIGYNGKRYQFGKQAHNDDQSGVHDKLITDKQITHV